MSGHTEVRGGEISVSPIKAAAGESRSNAAVVRYKTAKSTAVHLPLARAPRRDMPRSIYMESHKRPAAGPVEEDGPGTGASPPSDSKRPRLSGDGEEAYYPSTSVPIAGWIQPVSQNGRWSRNCMRDARAKTSFLIFSLSVTSSAYSADTVCNGLPALCRR